MGGRGLAGPWNGGAKLAGRLPWKAASLRGYTVLYPYGGTRTVGRHILTMGL